MARCGYCETRILFGGVSDHGMRFCNEDCQQFGALLSIADKVPEDEMAQRMAEVHQGQCPKCGGAGPIDVHTSYTVWSAIIMTSWNSKPQVCCRSCGIKSKLGSTLMCAVLGWWGIPWGLLATPIQILRNLAGLFTGPSGSKPSAQLQKMIKVNLAAQLVEARRLNQEEV